MRRILLAVVLSIIFGCGIELIVRFHDEAAIAHETEVMKEQGKPQGEIVYSDVSAYLDSSKFYAGDYNSTFTWATVDVGEYLTATTEDGQFYNNITIDKTKVDVVIVNGVDKLVIKLNLKKQKGK